MDVNAVLRLAERVAVEATLRCEAASRSLLILSIFFAGGLLACADTSVVPAADEVSRPNLLRSLRVGDVVTADVLAPFEFAVVNSEQTEKLRQQELAKVPAIYRFDPWVATQAEEKLAAAFSRVRTAFIGQMEVAARKKPLDEATIAHPSFWRFVAWFTNRYGDFPMSSNLARVWALGESDEPLRFRAQTALREVMGRYIRADAIPARADSERVQLFVAEKPNARPNLTDLNENGEIVTREEIATVSEARKELLARLAEDGEGFAGFAAGFVRENITFEDWPTAQRRKERSSELVVFDQYSPGQLVIGAGQLVDSRTKAALDILAAAIVRQQRHTPAAREQAPVSVSERWLKIWNDLRQMSQQHPAIATILVMLAIIVGWRFASSRTVAPRFPSAESYAVIKNPARNETVFLPIWNDKTSVGMAGATTSPPDQSVLHSSAAWQTQLREAEHRAEELLSLVRAGLAPHLAKELTRRLVQELVSQRASLLRAHQLAEQEILALEARFQNVHRDLRERLSLYETRVMELEKELANKSEQTRELLKATALLTQHKLEEKQAAKDFVCN